MCSAANYQMHKFIRVLDDLKISQSLTNQLQLFGAHGIACLLKPIDRRARGLLIARYRSSVTSRLKQVRSPSLDLQAARLLLAWGDLIELFVSCIPCVDKRFSVLTIKMS